MHETSVEGVTEWALTSVGDPGSFPDVTGRIRDGIPKALAPLLEHMTEGDTLWWCRSTKRGPLYGHEGVALVRQGGPVIYLLMLNY